MLLTIENTEYSIDTTNNGQKWAGVWKGKEFIDSFSGEDSRENAILLVEKMMEGEKKALDRILEEEYQREVGE